MKKYFCGKCGKRLKTYQELCPFCGFKKVIVNDKSCSEDNIKVIRKVKIEEKAKGRESLKIKQKQKGFKKFVRESIDGWFPSGDKKKFPDGVQKIRVINKENHKYQEKVINNATGEIVVNKNENLLEHKKL